MVSNQINVRLLKRYSSDTLMRGGALLSALAGGVLVINTWTDSGGLVLMVSALFLFVSATGFILANSIAGALGTFPEFAGSVSALTGSLQYGSGILGSALVAAFADGTPRAMGFVIAFCGIGGVLSATLFVPTSRAADSN